MEDVPAGDLRAIQWPCQIDDLLFRDDLVYMRGIAGTDMDHQQVLPLDLRKD